MKAIIEALKAEVAEAKAKSEAAQAAGTASQDATDAVWAEFFPLSVKYQAMANALAALERAAEECEQ